MLGIVQFILDLDAQLSDSLDDDLFSVVLLATDGQEQMSDKTREDLHQQSVLRSCDKVIDLQMTFPPCKEFFNLPSQLLDQSELLG